MSNRLLMGAALAALIAGAGVVNAQSPSGGAAGGGSTGGATTGAPTSGGASGSGASGERAAPSGGAMSRESGPAGHSEMNRGDNRGTTDRNQAQDQRGNDQRGGAANRNADERGNDRNMNNRNADDRNNAGRDAPRAAEERNERSSTTTGQAGAGGKAMTSEQRTRVSTVIRTQKVAPVSNINFSISVGTRVPRDIAFHPVPAEIVTIYPDWRGYQFFLARDEIIIVDPATLEIVAVLPA